MRTLVLVWALLSCVFAPTLRGDEAEIMQFVGPTMGTRYMVKIYEPPVFETDIHLQVDALLRQINDQMSTYLENSELSRFNRSESTEWFPVSSATADVVAFAQEVARQTDGAFDVTVGPIVNAWSFGPDRRTYEVPDQATLQQLIQSSGFKKLSVRSDPPSLRKEIPELQVDLSAVAKGYGVDQVVKLLNDAGAADVFVEIGGEIRTSGNKGGQWWKVGIQLPDAAQDEVMIAHALNTGAGDDTSMATSGDYRNFFEVDGVRYSHTIDPRTARPISHQLASVSIVAATCMEADAWATAINVLGPEDGLRLASDLGLDALLISRADGEFRLAGTGTLARYAAAVTPATAADATTPAAGDNALAVLAITTVAFAVILFAMAVGVMFGRRSISGSCGGLANTRNDDGSVSCSLCSNPADACKELRQRMEQSHN